MLSHQCARIDPLVILYSFSLLPVDGPDEEWRASFLGKLDVHFWYYNSIMVCFKIEHNLSDCMSYL